MIVKNYSISSGKGQRVLLINPPIYDTRYWDKWRQPYGLLKIARLLKNKGYKVELIDCLEPEDGNNIKKSIRGSVRISDIEMRMYHYGITFPQIARRMDGLDFVPTKVFVTSIMTYWWQSTRDTIELIRTKYPRAEIILGGIYPTLCPEHADENTDANLTVMGEVREASNLWTDISLYEVIPDYAVITASRGCPYDCAHCAQRAINGPGVRHRHPEDVFEEIRFKNKKYGISKFAFYEDNILLDCETNFEKILDLVIKHGLHLQLSAPEGFEIRLLYLRLLKKMKKAGFRSIYLPLEIASYDGDFHLDQKKVTRDEFDKVVDYCRMAGFKPGIRQELNAFILYGVPNQPIDSVIDAILYAAHRVGNVTPMLYTPVPGSRLYKKYKWYFNEKNLALEDLNGKLFPFWELDNLKPSDYIELQRLMYSLHTQLRGKGFDLLGDSIIAESVRRSITKWKGDSICRK